LFDAIKNTSGLYDKVTEIRCGVLGTSSETDLSHPIFNDSKVKLLFHSTNLDQYERPTLERLYEDSVEASDNFSVLYIHTKGVRYNGTNVCVTDWVDYLTYFNIEKHNDCLLHLQNNNVVGVNLVPTPSPHFSGNFWWSQSDYIRTLDPKIDESNYIAPELWIGQHKHGVYYSLFNSSIRNHYEERFSPEKYIEQ